ncbi:hypothetical protein FS749_006564 [Ceratobasidium sp. UAMH 11750]|nr:hypothetical protein FS749_006564 [Ceratobasidium sp. UAMH 11750]
MDTHMDPDANSHTSYSVGENEGDTSPTYNSSSEFPSISDDAMFATSSTSGHTMSTLSSVEVTDYFRSIHGSTYAAGENIPITFPVDRLRSRLDVVLHTIVRLSYNGVNVPAETDAMLRAGGVDHGLQGARVLDIVTNSGSWVREMASAYPNATFVSIDAKPLTRHEPHPRIEFEVYDYYTGIRQSASSFDLVHVRQGVLSTKDFNSLLGEMHRVLKPNGILLMTEFPPKLYEGENVSEPLRSATQRTEGLRLFREAFESQGIDMTIWDEMIARLSPTHSLWTNSASDPGHTNPGIVSRGFHHIVESHRLVPTGPWHPDDNQMVIGGLARLLFGFTWKALLPLLLMKSMRETEARAVVDGILEEFVDDRFKAYLKCHMWSARKI